MPRENIAIIATMNTVGNKMRRAVPVLQKQVRKFSGMGAEEAKKETFAWKKYSASK